MEVSDTQLESAFVTMDNIRRIIQDSIAAQAKAKLQSEGLAMIGTVLHAQQAYLLENNKFSNSIDSLGVSFPDNSNYDYSVFTQSDRLTTLVTETTTAPDLKSFLGLGRYSSNKTKFQRLFCETSEASQTLPIGPGDQDINQCPVGMEEVQ